MAEEKITPVDKKGNKKKRVIIIVIVLVILTAIAANIFRYIMRDPKRIFAAALDKFSDSVEEILPDDTTEFLDNYALKTNVDLTVQSDYLEYFASLDPNYQLYLNLVNNINQMDTEITTICDKKSKEQLTTIVSQLDGQELFNFKYLIQDQTAYYFLKNYLDTYINIGENQYFSDIETNSSSREITYIYNTVIRSIKRNLKSSYFRRNGDNQIALIINNQVAEEMATNILEDLKADEKARAILEKYYPDFNQATISDNQIMEEGSSIQLIVYTRPFTYSVRGYGLLIENQDGSTGMIRYQEGLNDNRIDLLVDDEVVGYITIDEQEDNTVLSMFDATDVKMGSLSFIERDDHQQITLEFMDEDASLLFDITTEETTDTTGTVNLQLKITGSGATLLDVGAKATYEQIEMVDINENVTNAIKEDDLTEEQQTQLGEWMMQLLATLMETADLSI